MSIITTKEVPPMRRIMLLLGVSCLLVLCVGGLWHASQPPIQLLLPPDSTDIHLDAVGWWEWTLTYRTPGPADGWYVTVVHQLEAAGWLSMERHPSGPLGDPMIYRRTISFGCVVIWERVELDGDVHSAHIRVYRRITLSC
jgi:hypothetical protein